VAKHFARLHSKNTLEKSRGYAMKKGVHIITMAKEQIEKTWLMPIKNKELTDL
jgi:hypothetical protein